MACDMCGKRGVGLVILNDGYQTDEVKDICRECEKSLERHLSRMLRQTDGILRTFMKRFVMNKREERMKQ